MFGAMLSSALFSLSYNRIPSQYRDVSNSG